MDERRVKLPADLIAKVQATGDLAVLAGCDAHEAIELCKRTMADWLKSDEGKRWEEHAGR
ncbi:hypothetical protein IMCC20628_01838 [Hoeflea sp. IMCC20628]|nr:hypothetical protein IMCC20628_01838 [Hoeflea sp. IMCC20628]